ncbi:Crp/Fnr family transcriptional regulator [Salegentibacter sp. JZCK2]|uniref:Crp/Fnr family transcriptional regulator n=1 Tax=Salegentibacter tibetensis TaxID=2873600 RepID=UPI001CCA105E|nr:Crp/Fnr family transcriptional regulator [Salegentibacter tibetensis]MBZ9730973.1 Crp/Fnr family transcriptional regulator [Salegentibacter tibetensis]
MKRILCISGKGSGHLSQDELSGLKAYECLQTDSLKNLENLITEKKPDLLIWGSNAEISSEIFNRALEMYKIPLLSIITKDEFDSWKPIHPNHHYLLNLYSQAELLQKIELLLKQKNLNGIENKKINKTTISNIEALKSYIEEKGERISLDKHKIIFRENRHSSFIYLISKGLVKTSRMDQLGKELITGIYRENELLGLYGFHKNPTCPEMATTLEPSKLYRILHKEFREILQENQGLSLDIAQYLTDTVLRLKSQLLEMAYASVLKKTSNTILQFAEELQSPDFQGLRISRTDLASIAGISPESFIRSLSSLKKEGIIAIKGRKINILKPERLQEIT